MLPRFQGLTVQTMNDVLTHLYNEPYVLHRFTELEAMVLIAAPLILLGFAIFINEVVKTVMRWVRRR